MHCLRRGEDKSPKLAAQFVVSFISSQCALGFLEAATSCRRDSSPVGGARRLFASYLEVLINLRRVVLCARTALRSTGIWVCERVAGLLRSCAVCPACFFRMPGPMTDSRRDYGAFLFVAARRVASTRCAVADRAGFAVLLAEREAARPRSVPLSVPDPPLHVKTNMHG